jgi:hypothetical protein
MDNKPAATPQQSPRCANARNGFLHPARRDRTPAAAAGLFPGPRAGTRITPQETQMNTTHANPTRLSTLGATLAALVLYVVVAIGIPWVLNEAPPSPEAAFASRMCCAKGDPAGR